MSELINDSYFSSYALQNKKKSFLVQKQTLKIKKKKKNFKKFRRKDVAEWKRIARKSRVKGKQNGKRQKKRRKKSGMDEFIDQLTRKQEVEEKLLQQISDLLSLSLSFSDRCRLW